MQTLYLIIDVQNDFVDGVFETKFAKLATQNIASFISNLPNTDDNTIILTRDLHDENYLNTQEGQNLPILHCQKGTWGAELHPELLASLNGKTYEIINKSSFASLDLLKIIGREKPYRVILMGICTDICVISNALLIKSHFPELPIFVKSSCMAGTTEENHKNALEVLKSCQIYDLD